MNGWVTGDGFQEQPHLYTLASPPLGPTFSASFLSPAPQLAGPARRRSCPLGPPTRSAPVAPLSPPPPTCLASFIWWNYEDTHVRFSSLGGVVCWSSQAPVLPPSTLGCVRHSLAPPGPPRSLLQFPKKHLWTCRPLGDPAALGESVPHDTAGSPRVWSSPRPRG